MGLTVGSLFSGIGGFDLGLERAGFEVRWQVENDPFCNKILARHWPEVTRYGDITTVDAGQLERVDLVCGGFPCQDVSVAGKRAGLAGERSSLFWEFVRLARALRPRWLLVENVPGLFSSNDGRDFRGILSALEELGYGVAWRVLDSRYFGVPQRRRRVFIVGRAGAYCPPEVLFEPSSGQRDSPESFQAREDLAPGLRARAGESPPLDAQRPVHAVRLAQTGANGLGVSEEETHALDGTGGEAVTFRQRTRAPTTLAGAPADPDGVREVTGFPRGLDTPRYRALGNAVTVPVAEWIGRRILEAS